MQTTAVYARVSSDVQKKNQTIGSQTQALMSHAEKLGFVVADDLVFEDEGYSGATLVRPGLDRVRDLAAEGRLDVLLVYSPDRLSRKYPYQVLLIEEFERNGVDVQFINAPAGKTPEGELLVQFQGMIAEYERAQIRERSRRGKMHRAKAGSVNVLSGAPYGYLYVSKDNYGEARYEVIEEQAEVVVQVFEMYTEQGMTINAIARWLNDHGVATRTGKSRWCRSTVWAMLRNPAYKGMAAFGKTQVAERQRITRPLRQKGGYSPRSSSNRELPRDQWIGIPVPAIVSEEVYEAAGELLERNRRQHPRGTTEPSLLQGMLVCNRCGYACYRTSTRTSKRKIYYYRCLGSDGYRYEGGARCDNRPVRQDALDDIVWESVIELLCNPQLVREEIDRRIIMAGNSGSDQIREEKLRDKRKRLEKQHQRLLDAYQEELVDIDELRKRAPELDRKIKTVDSDLRFLTSAAEEKQRYLKISESVEGFIGKVKKSADISSTEEKRKILKLVVKEILVDYDTITIRHSIPTGRRDKILSTGGNLTASDESCQQRSRRDQSRDVQHLPSSCHRQVV